MPRHESVTLDEPEAELPRHPYLRLIGPIELLGAAAPAPTRARRQCEEYCAWLLENPRSTATQMADELVVAETTRRSNMSRLRSWLGSDAAGKPYLPEAYSGRIELHPGVESDWQRVQVLTAPGLNRLGPKPWSTCWSTSVARRWPTPHRASGGGPRSCGPTSRR